MENCLNCNTPLAGKFCHGCGQKVIEPSERTIKHFLYQFLGSAFFLENNFFKNLWVLLTRPGKIAHDFIEGRRKRWMPPFSVFLLINLLFFIFNPLTDFNLSLSEQLQQHEYSYSPMARRWVEEKIQQRGITYDEYKATYAAQSSGLTKTLIIVNVPVMALMLSLLFIRKKRYYADHFVYSLYLFAFLLLMSLLVAEPLRLLMSTFKVLPPMPWLLPLLLFTSLFLYLFFSIRKVYQVKGAWILLYGPLVLIVLVLTTFFYRFFLFTITFLTT